MSEQPTPTLDDISVHIIEQDAKSAVSAYRAAAKQIHLTTARRMAVYVLKAFPTARFIDLDEDDQQHYAVRPYAILDANREPIEDNGGFGGEQVFADEIVDELYSYSSDLPFEKPAIIVTENGHEVYGPDDTDYDWFVVGDEGRSKSIDIAKVLDQYRASR